MQRRHFLRKTMLWTSALLTPSVRNDMLWASPTKPISKKIPSSGESVPVIGMGTWISFNVGDHKQLRLARTKVLAEFLGGGGKLIDSSPMYGSSEEVLGFALEKLKAHQKIFAATKLWTSSGSEGKQQFKDSQKFWGLQQFDLEQIHNLLNWQEHLPYLQMLKKAKKIRYLGITTSHGRRHGELESIMKKHPLDFVQLTYNVMNRAVENRLLPLAKERNIAVIVNRPFGGGEIIKSLKRKALPPWAASFGCQSWAELLLKYIVSHPAVTVAIPATTKVEHMKENMAAAQGSLLDQNQRAKISDYVSKI